MHQYGRIHVQHKVEREDFGSFFAALLAKELDMSQSFS